MSRQSKAVDMRPPAANSKTRPPENSTGRARSVNMTAAAQTQP